MKNVFKLLLLLALCGCECCGNRSSTPTKYKYKISKEAKTKYSNDTLAIRPILMKMLSEKVKPFNLKVYSNSTEIFIDSLIYSPDQLRMIAFVIIKNSTLKTFLHRENDSSYYYDAYYLPCLRQTMQDTIKVYGYNGYGLINFYNYKEISEALRDHCFNQMQRVENKEEYYNINDKRFWNSKYLERVLKNSTAINP